MAATNELEMCNTQVCMHACAKSLIKMYFIIFIHSPSVLTAAVF